MTAKKPEGNAAEPTRIHVADGLYVVMVQGSALKEQELNAQVMDPTRFDRLVENIRIRGGMESVPYCHQPGGVGPISIISGHHRAKAARVAGLTQFPILVDTYEMPRSLVRAKQIAHNELIGSPDEELLRRMLGEIDNVDHLLITGLPDDYLPPPDPSHTTLAIPHAEFDWRMVTLTFLPEQLERVEELVKLIDSNSALVGVARRDQFAEFSEALVNYSQARNIKSMAAVVDVLTQNAIRELKALKEQP